MYDYDYHVTFVGYLDPRKDRSLLKDSMGRYRTNIFHEFNKTRHEEYPPLYTMREDSHSGLPSAYQIYMASDSEYEAAMKLVGSWNHWNRLLKSRPFMEGPEEGATWVGLTEWRKEKQIKDKATAYNQLKISAAGGNVPAQKLLFEGDKSAGQRGRPSKEQIERAAKEEAALSTQITDDLKRIRLIADNGISK